MKRVTGAAVDRAVWMAGIAVALTAPVFAALGNAKARPSTTTKAYRIDFLAPGFPGTATSPFLSFADSLRAPGWIERRATHDP